MKKMKLFNFASLFVLVALLSGSTTLSAPMTTMTFKWPSNFRPHGGYIDNVIFNIYQNDWAEMLLALKKGEIDASTEDLIYNARYLPGLVLNPNVEVAINQKPYFRQLSLNCGRFPTNITGYRRALAFAIDKVGINYEIDGGAGTPIDTYMPSIATEWEIESSLPTHFYEPDIDSGIAALERAGFRDLDGDGWREFDADDSGTWSTGDKDHQECAIEIYATIDYDPAIIVSEYAAKALQAMGINATVVEMDFSLIYDKILANDAWTMCFTWAADIVNPVEYLYQLFRTGQSYSDMIYRLNNATINAALDEMMAATTLEDVKAKSAEVLLLLNHEQPMIACYSYPLINTYRTDKFEGFFNFKGMGITGENPYCLTHISLKESEGGPIGGTFRYGSTEDIYSTNVLNYLYYFNKIVFDCIYERLWQSDPNNWDPIPQLAYNWTIEETTAGGGFQDGQKFTFYLNDNATWHDGQPVTSADVEYSFETLWPRSNDYGSYLENVYRVDRPSDYIVEIYTNQSGYFEWSRATGLPVLPMHIWNTHGPDFETWIPTTAADLTGSGPYKWVEYVPGEYINLTRHTDWQYDARLSVSHLNFEESPNSEKIPMSKEAGRSAASSGFEIYIAVTMFVVIGVATLYFRQRRRKYQ
ncbi:MAG: ABC transporter substrate-binding protein [Promethearchaeota archaeon]